MIHVPDRKPGAVDRYIMLDLDRFERAHKPPATVVLISGDIDFVGKLSDLRHHAGFNVIVIHNQPAKSELKATVNAHYDWSMFTGSAQVVTQPFVPRTTYNQLGAPFPRFAVLPTNQPPPNRLPLPPSHWLPRSRLNRPDSQGLWSSPEPKFQQPRRSNSRQRRPSRPQQEQKVHDCPECHDEFGSIDALRQHQNATEHLFDCPKCPNRFFTFDGLLQHMKAKHGDDLSDDSQTCSWCNASFNSIPSLIQHQRDRHDSWNTRPESSDNEED
ncbi:unnamed protein product [Didymodactylos carnosus]|uniref:C2H2-type domain-containing protein n=1 Tax=Didymodactylos carnosus TaxID=1234261 RepID=A0A814I2V0_9BILA|nr:unnamed protein product [Didymodactylos carnosus]CAF1147896.1 unnamed protein product [Didymodactylos carnosus]CAF3789648.1 unnamed protein product [Didymodactylos carnosus]CAF3951277.1 unnamed protein product [Didymodactylos carnosus]